MKEESIIWIYLCLRPRVGRRRKECSINMDMDRFTEIVGPESIRTQEPMSRHTTFRIGGPADVFVTPKNSQDLAGVLAYCKEEQIPYFILGNGSNLLVPDEGFRGVIICTRGLDFIQFQDTRVTAGSGMLLSRLAALVAREGLTGLNIVAMDLVEVAPAYDPTGQTQVVANEILREFLSILSYNKKAGK